MEGYGFIEDVDIINVPDRFKVLAAVDFPLMGREKFNWYTATPPIVRPETKLSVLDWFGRTMVDNLPEDVTVGVVCVALGSSKLEYLAKDFDPNRATEFDTWFRNIMAQYDNQPYNVLINCARKAQEQGTIKGILFQQGESDLYDPTWPERVKQFYNDILTDLNLEAADVPLFVGEAVPVTSEGQFGLINGMIADLPDIIPTAHIISASGLTHKTGDYAHFSSESYRVLGCRYAETVLRLQGIQSPKVAYSAEYRTTPTPNPDDGDYEFPFSEFNPFIKERVGSWNESTGAFTQAIYSFGGWEYDSPIDLSGYRYIVAELSEPQQIDTSFKIYDNRNYWAQCIKIPFGLNNTTVIADLQNEVATCTSESTVPFDASNIYRLGFSNWGGSPIYIKRVYATNTIDKGPSNIDDIVSDTDSNRLHCIYNLQGIAIPTADISSLPHGIYLVDGKKVFIGK